MLRKLGLLDAAIDYAVESGAFQQAFELTRAGAKHKLPDVRNCHVHPFMTDGGLEGLPPCRLPFIIWIVLTVLE